MITPPSADRADAPPQPWARGGRTLFLCPRPSCRGDAWCPEARHHVFVPVEPRRRGRQPVTLWAWLRQRRQPSAVSQ